MGSRNATSYSLTAMDTSERFLLHTTSQNIALSWISIGYRHRRTYSTIRSLWSWLALDLTNLRTPDTTRCDFLGFRRFIRIARSKILLALLRCRSLQDDAQNLPERARLKRKEAGLRSLGQRIPRQSFH